MDNDLPPMTPPPEHIENTPIEGEHFTGSGGGGLSRAQIFAPLACALLLVSAVYGWSLRAPRTIAGLRAGGQAVGDVAFGALDGALDKAADAYLDSRVVLTFGSDERVAKRRDLGFVVDRAAARELVKSAGKCGNPLADVALRFRARRGKVDLALPVDVDRAKALEFLTEL